MMVLIIIPAVVGLWAVFIFNRLIHDQNLMREGFSGIDVQLKRRYDLIPNILEAVKGYMQFERGTLEAVTRLRAQIQNTSDSAQKSNLENDLSRSLKSIFAVVEAYPDLKANKSITELQNSLVDIEDQIQMARRYYNGCVRNFNITVQSFPNNLVAGVLNFRPAAYFEIEYATERQVPDVKF